MLLDTWPVRAKLEPKVHRTSLSEPYTFWDFGRRCTGALYRSRTPFAPGSEGVRVARLRPYTFWVFGQRCADSRARAAHLLSFRPKVYGFQSAGRSPFVIQAKGVRAAQSKPFTFCPWERRCAGCPAAAVHLLGFRPKVHRTSLSEPYTFWVFGQRCTGLWPG